MRSRPLSTNSAALGAARHVGVGPFEERHDEVADLARGGRFLLGQRFGLQGAVALDHQLQHEGRAEHQDAAAGQHPGPAPAHQLAQAIPRAARSCSQRKMLAKVAQVAQQRRHAVVALLGVQRGGLGHDGLPFVGAGRRWPDGVQQLVQRAAQAEDVAGAGGVEPGHLFGAGVARRQRSADLAGLAQQLRHAEVQQHRVPVLAHQHIARLDVAVHDQLTVRVAHRTAHLFEQGQHRFQIQPPIAAIAVQRVTLDVFHHQVGSSGRCGAAVQQPCDVRVVQLGQDLPFVRELGQRCFAAEAAQQLDGGTLFVQSVAALGQHHPAHAAAAELAAQRPRAESVADGQLGFFQAGQHAGDRDAQAMGQRAILIQQGQHAPDLFGVGAQFVQPRAARGLVGQVADRFEAGLDLREIGVGRRFRHGSGFKAAPELLGEPGARKTQFTVHRGHRDAQQIGDFLARQAHEVGQLHHLRGTRVVASQRVEQPVQREQVGGHGLLTDRQRAQRHLHPVATALVGQSGAGVIAQHPAHGQRNGGEEVRAVGVGAG
ncbi:MAG TPA: hypothetical protein PLA97_21505 [Rubrivivax sp.]|nr:hypothetical protein [Rubrivivax sp.]